MLNIGNKTFMNLQEAVGWLLENNALPFQSTANYVANTEIAMSTLVNPSPAKVRVGSLIFFADSKVSTVIGVTSNSFIVSDQYNDLVDDIVYVSNVAINASGHLIVTLSNGDDIDAGLIKQVSSFSINGSQHLIASYNDGTSTDLGAIFTGNVNISGTLNATAITGDSIIENMTGYAFALDSNATNYGFVINYAGVVKNGNKITFALAGTLTRNATTPPNVTLANFTIPNSIGVNLIPNSLNSLDNKNIALFDSYNSSISIPFRIRKPSNTRIDIDLYGVGTTPTLNTTYEFRYECTFLLSTNLAS